MFTETSLLHDPGGGEIVPVHLTGNHQSANQKDRKRSDTGNEKTTTFTPPYLLAVELGLHGSPFAGRLVSDGFVNGKVIQGMENRRLIDLFQ